MIAVCTVAADSRLKQILACIVVVETAYETELALVLFVTAGGLVLVAGIVQLSLGKEVEIFINAVIVAVAFCGLADNRCTYVVLAEIHVVVGLQLIVVDMSIVVGVLYLYIGVPVLVGHSTGEFVVGVHLPVLAQNLGLGKALVKRYLT